MTALLLLWLALLQTAGQPSAAGGQPATAVIRGRVTDKDSGVAIARALVRLGSRDIKEQRAARTDSEGRFEFTGLPAGRYSGLVTAGEHRATHLMGWLATAGRGEILLKAGEVRDDLNVALVRSLAITVRVVDEWGEPLAGVNVAVRSDAGNESGQRWMRMTDDRGLLRVYQLAPGRYVVCAEGSSAFSGNTSRRERFLRTCYPSATSETQAQFVRLEKSDVDGIEIQMQRGRTFTISGMVVDANGTIARNPSLNFSTFEPNGSSSSSISVGADGSFSVSNVAPGEYTIEATMGGPERPEQRQGLEVAFQPVVVSSSDIEGLVVAMSKGVDVAGRFVLEDPSVPLPTPGAGLFVSARLAGDQLPGHGSTRTATADADRVFRLSGIFGKRMLGVANIPRGWYAKSITYGGKEIIDVATELKAGTDPSELEIVLSSRGATITGRVTDERGDPVRGARVFVLPATPAHRETFPDYATTAPSGAYRAGPRRAGDYLVFALDPASPIPRSGSTPGLAQLAATGERITLGENEERALDLTAVKIER